MSDRLDRIQRRKEASLTLSRRMPTQHASPPPKRQPKASSAPIWPMSRYNAKQTGKSTYTRQGNNSTLNLEFEGFASDGNFSTTSPAIDNAGNIYVGIGTTLYSFSVNSEGFGVTRWQYDVSGHISSSPAINNGVVYVGSDDKYVYALNATTGALRWKFKTVAAVGSSSPTIGTDGIVYIGSGNTLYAINTNGTKKWSLVVGGTISSSPAINSDGTIYIGSSNNYVYAVSPSGKLAWKYNTSSSITTSPVISSVGANRIYIGSGNKVCALKPNGILDWKYVISGNITSSPAVCMNGAIYVGTSLGVQALNPNGTNKWLYTTPGIVYSSPVIDNSGIVYICSYSGTVYAHRPSDNTDVWVSIGFNAPTMYSSPAIGSDGKIHIGAAGCVYAV